MAIGPHLSDVHISISSDVSVYSNASLDISVYEQSYILPAGVTALAITSTKYGITLKDVIGTYSDHCCGVVELTFRRNSCESSPANSVCAEACS